MSSASQTDQWKSFPFPFHCNIDICQASFPVHISSRGTSGMCQRRSHQFPCSHLLRLAKMSNSSQLLAQRRSQTSSRRNRRSFDCHQIRRRRRSFGRVLPDRLSNDTASSDWSLAGRNLLLVWIRRLVDPSPLMSDHKCHTPYVSFHHSEPKTQKKTILLAPIQEKNKKL